MPIKTQSRTSLLITIGLIAITTAINTDLYLSTLPVIADYFRTSNNASQFSIAIFKWGLVPSLLVYGPISERIGRKLAISIGLAIAIIGSLICYYSTSINILYVGRFMQGVGCAGPACLWRALFRDHFSTQEMAKYSSYLGIMMIVTLSGTPLLGGYIYSITNWQANFLTLAILMLTLLFIVYNYTHAPDIERQPLGAKTIWRDYLTTFKKPGFIPYTLCATCGHFALFSWVTEAPVLLIHELGVTPIEFGKIMLLVGASAVISGNLLNIRLSPRYGPDNMIILSIAIMIAGLAIMLATLLHSGLTLASLIIPVIIFFFGLSFLWPNTFSLAFANSGTKSGYTASLYSFIQQLGGALAATIVAHMFDAHTQLGLILCLTGGLLGIISAFLTARWFVKNHNK